MTLDIARPCLYLFTCSSEWEWFHLTVTITCRWISLNLIRNLVGYRQEVTLDSCQIKQWSCYVYRDLRNFLFLSGFSTKSLFEFHFLSHTCYMSQPIRFVFIQWHNLYLLSSSNHGTFKNKLCIMRSNSTVFYIILYCIILYYIISYHIYSILYYITLHYIHYIVLYYIILHTLYRIISYHILYYIYYIILYYTAHYRTFHILN